MAGGHQNYCLLYEICLKRTKLQRKGRVAMCFDLFLPARVSSLEFALALREFHCMLRLNCSYMRGCDSCTEFFISGSYKQMLMETVSRI